MTQEKWQEEISSVLATVEDREAGSVDYCVADPTGNITILVTTSVETALQPSLAARLMEIEKEAEQVGFLSDDSSCDIALRMAGGEFCGNATMSAAVFAASRAGLTKSDIILRVSGAPEPVKASVCRMDDGSWKGTVNMPRPVSVDHVSLPGAGTVPVVRFEGICHVILEEAIFRPEAEKCAIEWCSCLDTDAVGLMFLDRANSRLTPLVYVPAADTLCWENSCASGTTAAGAFLAAESGKPVRAELHQPGGTLTVEASGTGNLSLTGNVRILKKVQREGPESGA